MITLAEAILIMAFEPVPLGMLLPLLLQALFLLVAAVIAGLAGERGANSTAARPSAEAPIIVHVAQKNKVTVRFPRGRRSLS